MTYIDSPAYEEAYAAAADEPELEGEELCQYAAKWARALEEAGAPDDVALIAAYWVHGYLDGRQEVIEARIAGNP